VPEVSSAVPAARRRVLVERPPRADGDFVVYWMTSARRLGWNYALDRAVELAESYGRPLLVLEAVRCGYRWASDRLHRFVLEGMADNARRAAATPATYHPYVEPDPGAGKGLIAALSRRAVAIVADDFPTFFLPRMLAAAARQVDCRLEAVDSNGLLPMAAADRDFATAYALRRFLQANLKGHLLSPPGADPLARLRAPRLERLPPELELRWPAADAATLAGAPGALAALPIDHAVAPVASLRGGAAAARAELAAFLDRGLARYADERRHPDAEAASGLSPWLHFGHLSVHEVVDELARRERWSPESLPERGNGAREGWWGASRGAEALLDELVTWRELGCHVAHRRPADHDRYESLPAWARATLEKHAGDLRPALLDLDRLAAAASDDGLWNAAQRQLAGEGRIHNYLRMLWGKRVLEWTPGPREALDVLFELNNRFALDGRDPNSATGILWCLGRHDRPWAPERPIFGVVRYMSSAATRRKLDLDRYLERWGDRPALFAGRD
jgi:deoxyribodipyrimidine photo-lyase